MGTVLCELLSGWNYTMMQQSNVTLSLFTHPVIDLATGTLVRPIYSLALWRTFYYLFYVLAAYYHRLTSMSCDFFSVYK